MFYFARLFDRPVYAWHQRRYRYGASALDLLWYDPRGTDADVARLPLDAWFHNVDVVFLRGKWNDPDAVFVGLKGGDNRANHSHLDLGTFVLDAQGQRWAVDIGADDYNLPGYFGDKRWTYYRLRTEGHNTLVMNGENQDPAAKAPIKAFESTRDHSFAVADLSAAYAKSARGVQRGIAMLDRKHVLVQDEIEAETPVDVEWTMHTNAEAKIDGAVVTLSQKGEHYTVRAVDAAGGSWSVMPVRLKSPQRPLENTRKLVLRFQAKPPLTRVAVLLSPSEKSPPPPIRPLREWHRDQDCE
mgnify:CR=1 FL=1